MKKQPPETGNLKFLLVLAMMSWGGAWVGGKIIVDAASLEVILFWRFLFTAIPITLIIFKLRENIRIPIKIIPLLLAGIFFYTGYNYIFFLGLQKGLAGAGGVMVTSLVPVFTSAFTLLLYRKKPALFESLGLLLGLIGGAILIQIWNTNATQLFNSGNLYFIMAAGFWVFVTVIAQNIQKTISFWSYSFYLYTLSSIITLFFALPNGLFSFHGNPMIIWLGILYLALFSTVFGTSIYFYSSSKLGSNTSSSFVFLVPTSALLLSWIILKETPQMPTIIGGSINILAVYMINRNKKTRA